MRLGRLIGRRPPASVHLLLREQAREVPSVDRRRLTIKEIPPKVSGGFAGPRARW